MSEINESIPSYPVFPVKRLGKTGYVCTVKDERLLLTLTRDTEDDPWGFSAVGSKDILEQSGFWSGIITARHQQGLWIAARSIRRESAAEVSGLKENDLITRINGRIVFHLTPDDVQRLIVKSGCTLYLDIERNVTKSRLYNSGLHQFSFNFLYNDIHKHRVGDYEKSPRWGYLA
ncbi:uncharacterized protein LOC111696722 [Eurytemora carolleeae]|uniref:uncharacterized protein LOC111696722 n=1 Tax=Eurytemora carolleeae TaxID=1294199 RepID=UPI000C773EB6|nr:uncharacterized protein LOC111696722 [Eurytemora carolleeae]|eukprot:XP_023322197.1 uncharacterized protein LOC111696722 [Eurytemora affinis]